VASATVGRDIALALGRAFIDADDLHPFANKAKMGSGNPLDDEDRWPWLDIVGAALELREENGLPPVVACSALKRVYRDRPRVKAPSAVFVLLDGSRELLRSRIGRREHEFMPATLLDSKLATLEALENDEDGVVIDIAPLPLEVTANALKGIRQLLLLG